MLLFVLHRPHGCVSASWYGEETEERARVLAGREAPGPYANAALAAALRRS